MAEDIEGWYSPHVRYLKTPTSFIKRTRLHSERQRLKNGSFITPRKWDEERFHNEVAALRLVADNTTIPVPRVISAGKDENGMPYLETEYIEGVVLWGIEDQCWMPDGERHVEEGACETCGGIARANAERFITQDVLPQLSKLRSTTTGLNGFAIPPPWVLEYDQRQQWKPKTSDSASYVFCHGDLAAHNIMIDPKTLQVVCIFDWEHAGYFPPEFQVWFPDRESYHGYFRDKKRITKLVGLIDA
jgi:serine/threonine protein kinase